MSQRAQRWLKELGWSQAELARRLGVSPPTVTNWVNRSEFPKYSEAYLELAVEVARLGFMVQRPKRGSK